VSVNYELIFPQISPLRHPATQSMTSASHEKCGCTQMLNSNDVASSKMLWERVLSLLVVGASVLGGSADPIYKIGCAADSFDCQLGHVA
jgi:hypothetical protein